ncbi:MAG: single-stranded-DNA-specific exonuclease RecJ, partial [Clostridia bacterium]|nr:single-stranded-DNA-specific exonuclease RecJ [Clostridia bacterium]
MKRLVPEFTLTDEQLNIVRRLARECGLCEDTVRILYGRGVRDKESIEKFLHPSKAHFISPFKMSGMKEAVELITRARDEEWAVLVYGDYDADGVCAATIMGGALRDFGIEPFVFVPERTNGYGLSNNVIDKIFDEYFPQLVITVDCGISCAAEVEYLKELGAEVIVTDHHELPDEIPDCICINPKFNDGYEYDNLCGAGVAFKVGCALNGESAYKYLDFAAIATVADSVSLTGENRDIVFEGLKKINSAPAESYGYFLNKQDEVTSQTLAFSVAPKINAAGRMGDAKAALALFAEQDKNKIFELASKLAEYNIERQKYCDELYASAKEMINKKSRLGKVILLCNESWNTGFVGIVAARLAEEFSRPAILFVKHGDMLKGSARSIDNVNIFEALRACSEYITEFGGHAQAAGVNVSFENFELLETALDKYMTEHYANEDFIPTVYLNGELDDEYSAKYVKELELLEPFGVGNRKPLFAVEEKAVAVRPLRNNHILIKSSKLEMMYFGGAKYKKLIESSANKKFIFEYNVSSYRGKEMVKGFVRDLVYDNAACFDAREDIALSYIETLANPKISTAQTITKEEVEQLIKDGDSGTLFIAWDNFSVSSLSGGNKLNADIFVPSNRAFSSALLFAPSGEIDYSGYKRVIILNEAYGVRLSGIDGKCVEVCENAPLPQYLKKLSADRTALLSVFSELSANAGKYDGASAYEVVKYGGFDNKLQALFVLK